MTAIGLVTVGISKPIGYFDSKINIYNIFVPLRFLNWEMLIGRV